MQFASTRALSAAAAPPAAPENAVPFREALFHGLAPDGGLYHPVRQPNLSRLFATFSAQTSFLHIAEEVSQALLGDELDRGAIARIVRRAFSFAPLLRSLEPDLHLLELFHGPTCAFKDFGASFLASAMEELLQAEGRRALILVATSGDTGSAVARAFYRKANIDVAILYPSGRVSPRQEKQLTTLGENVTALEVKGNFDDCQRLAKRALLDEELRRRLALTSANSINLGRLIPQAFYYIYGYSRLVPAPGEQSAERPAEAPGPLPAAPGPVRFCVPSGNFGNLTAGVYAWQWGLPVKGFIAATNSNDVVPEYLLSGSFRPRPSVQTLSNAMDVGNPSNFERLLTIFDRNAGSMRAMIHGERITDEETRQAMRQVHREYGLLIDPHTAVGVLAAQRYRLKTGFAGQIIVLATAHPGKFPEIIQETLGVSPELPSALKELMDLPKRSELIAPNLEELRALLTSKYC